MKTIQGTIAEIKREILHDVRMGDMPIDVKSFGELHDYRDANCYGGFCDDALSDEMIAHFGGRDSDEGMPDGMLAYIDECQMAIDAWLRSGGLRRMFLEHDQEDAEQWANAYGHLLRKHKALVRAMDNAQAALRKAQTTLVAAFQESGEQWFADVAQELSILTGKQVGPQEQTLPNDNPAAGLKPYSAMVVRNDGVEFYTFVYATDVLSAIWLARRDAWIAHAEPSDAELADPEIVEDNCGYYSVSLLLEGHHPDILVN